MDTRKLIKKYKEGYQKLIDQLKDIPAEAMHFKPNKSSWSIAIVIVHLADSEAHSFVRGKKIIAESGGQVCVYNADVWAEKLFYDQMDYKSALSLIRIIRKNLGLLLDQIGPDVWNNYIYHPETGKITLFDWIQLYTDHIDIHIQQIHRIFYDWKKLQEKHGAGVV